MEHRVPNQNYLVAIAAREHIEKAAKYINEHLYTVGIIDREQQHTILWDLRLAFLQLNRLVSDIEVFEGSGRYGKHIPIDF